MIEQTPNLAIHANNIGFKEIYLQPKWECEATPRRYLSQEERNRTMVQLRSQADF